MVAQMLGLNEIISYQNVVGNYNLLEKLVIMFYIISYQNVVGNYNWRR